MKEHNWNLLVFTFSFYITDLALDLVGTKMVIYWPLSMREVQISPCGMPTLVKHQTWTVASGKTTNILHPAQHIYVHF